MLEVRAARQRLKCIIAYQLHEKNWQHRDSLSPQQNFLISTCPYLENVTGTRALALSEESLNQIPDLSLV